MLLDTGKKIDLHRFDVNHAMTFMKKGANLAVLLAKASPDNAEKFKPYLSPLEYSRAAKYLRPVDRYRSIVAHGVKRWFQSCLLGVPCDSLIYATRGKGKPYCNNPGAAYFNISHAGDWIVLGYSLTQGLGIDLEFANEQDISAIASYFLSRDELQWLENHPAKSTYLNRRWTQKEAASKYLELGLFLDFTTIHIDDTNNCGIVHIEGRDEVFSYQTYDFMDGHLSIATSCAPDAITMYSLN